MIPGNMAVLATRLVDQESSEFELFCIVEQKEGVQVFKLKANALFTTPTDNGVDATFFPSADAAVEALKSVPPSSST